MKARGVLAINLTMAALLASCGRPSAPERGVDMANLRGQTIEELSAVSEQSVSEKPFIEELPQPPVVTKPEEPLIAEVEPKETALPDPIELVQKPETGKPVPPPVELAQPAMIGDYSVISFDKLASFAYEVPDDPITDPKAKAIIEKNLIPKAVTDFHKKKIALKGYMLPLKVEGGKITEMLILRDQSMCCYGTVPKINEWVSVRMPKGKGVKPIMDVPITIFGTLKVGEVLENGYLVGIYELDGDRLGGPIDL